MNEYTGRTWEAEVLGEPTNRNIPKKFWTFDAAIYEAINSQGTWDPTDPDTRIANDLHAIVCEKLGVDDYSEVRMFKALNGPLDWFYGTDCFFEYRGKRALIDLTLREKGLEDRIEWHPSDRLEYLSDLVVSELEG